MSGWVSYKQHLLLGSFLLLSLYTAFIYIPAHLASQQQQQLYRPTVYNRGMGRGGVVGGAMSSTIGGLTPERGRNWKSSDAKRLGMTEADHTLLLKKAKQVREVSGVAWCLSLFVCDEFRDAHRNLVHGMASSSNTQHYLLLQDIVKKLDAIVLAQVEKKEGKMAEGVEATAGAGKGHPGTAASNQAVDPTLVLVSRNATVTADTRGNLGHPSVVVQYPPGQRWMKDRYVCRALCCIGLRCGIYM